MRRLLLPLALAGCASVSTNEAPCACIIHIPPEQMNGVVSLALDRAPVDFARFPDQQMPTSGVLWSVVEPYSGANAIALSSAGSFSVNADYGPVLDLSRPAPITQLDFNETDIAGVEWVDATSYELGPEGGTLRVNEIVPEADGGYRLRGGFTAQICPRDQASAGAPCRDIEGRFAFSDEDLPGNAITGNLLAGGA